MQVLQIRGMQIILQCDKYAPIKSIHDQLSFKPVYERTRKKLLIVMSKIVNGMAPAYYLKHLVDVITMFIDKIEK